MVADCFSDTKRLLVSAILYSVFMTAFSATAGFQTSTHSTRLPQRHIKYLSITKTSMASDRAGKTP